MPRLRTIAFVAFAAHEVEFARRPLVYAGGIDMATIDVIARLQQRSRRAGLDMTLHDPVPELAELLAFAGLDAMIGSG